MKKIILLMAATFICGVVLPQYVTVQRHGEKMIRVYVSEKGIAYPYYSSLKDAKKFITKPQEEGNKIVTGKHPNYSYWVYRRDRWEKVGKL